MFGIRLSVSWLLIVLLCTSVLVGTQGCGLTTVQPPASFACDTDFDCLADQICQDGKCVNQVNRPNPPLPPIDSGPLPDVPGPIDTAPTEPPTPDVVPPVDFGLPPDAAPDRNGVCSAGTKAPCYQGPAGTNGKGICQSGVTICNDEGQWGPCVGQVLPEKEELCDDGRDNNCDGKVDEGCPPKGCPDGAVQSCYEGPLNTRNIGECQTGKQTCTNGAWGACEGQVLPQPELCKDNKDNDCDGRTDEECGNCPEGQQRPCYGGTAGCIKQSSGGYICKGVCKAGFQICANGEWDVCQGDAKDSPERCNGLDDNCDGQVDEGNPNGGTACTFPGAPGACAQGKLACAQGKLVCTQVVQPVQEICDNGIDDNCDGQIDEGCMGGVIILTSITPNTGNSGSNYNGTLKGAGFNPGAIVEIADANTPTPTYANITSLGGKITSLVATEIQINFLPIPTTLKPGNYFFRVVNPGNNPSNTVLFVLGNQTGGNGPTITSLTPNVAQVGASYSGTFTGTGYNVGATVEIRAPIVGQFVNLGLLGGAVTITRVNDTTLTLVITTTPGDFNGISLKGSHDVRIVNTDSTFSNTVKLTIQ